MVGYLTENTLKNFRADIAFIGANGVTRKDGATTPNHVGSHDQAGHDRLFP